MAILQITLTPEDRNNIITSLKEDEKYRERRRKYFEEIGRLDNYTGNRYQQASEEFFYVEAKLQGKREGLSLVLGYEGYAELCKDTRLRRGADHRTLDDPSDENAPVGNNPMVVEALQNIQTYLRESPDHVQDESVGNPFEHVSWNNTDWHVLNVS